MDYHGFHSARLLVDEHLEHRRQEASDERLVKRLGGATQPGTGRLARTVSSLIHRDTRPARVRPES